MSSKQWLKTIHSIVGETLYKYGFSSHSANYVRDTQSCILIVNIQRSDDSAAMRLKVTCNLGLFITTLPSSEGIPVDIWSCHWRRRLGFLTPQKQDVWWVISSDAEADSVAHDIALNLSVYGLPGLMTKSSIKAMLDYWRSGESAGLTDVERRRYLAELEGCDADG